MSAQSDPAVFSLPDELLLCIFHIFVSTSTGKSPVVLTHVCTLWRHLILTTGALWRHIDIHSIRRAKHHLALACGQSLAVAWVYTRQALPQLDKYEWIFSQASRFRSLALSIPGPSAETLLGRLGFDLSLLRRLLIVTSSVSRINASTLMSVLRGSHLLETLELIRIQVSTTDWEALQLVDSVQLPYLRSCRFACVDEATQGFLTSTIEFPRSCVLHLDLTSSSGSDGAPLLHPSTAAAFHPIWATTVHFQPASQMFAESKSGPRCTLNITVRCHSLHRLAQCGLDIAALTTVEVHSSGQLSYRHNKEPQVIKFLENILPYIRSLVIHGSALPNQSLKDANDDRWLWRFLPAENIRTLTLRDMDLDTDTSPGLARIQVICRFVQDLSAEQRAALPNVVLRDCTTSKDGLSMLRAINLPVESAYGQIR